MDTRDRTTQPQLARQQKCEVASRRKYNGPRPLTILLSIIALFALIHLIAVTHTAYPTAPINDCLNLIRNTDYSKFVQLQPQMQQINDIQFVDQLVGGQPAALVSVTDNSPQHLLDLYIYGCSSQKQNPALTLLFKQQGLVQGTASVTGANTLSVGELDRTLTQNATMLMDPLQQNIYREYSWRNNALVQTSFPGLYPVINRSEAEELQEQVSNGQALPWTDPLTTVQQVARDILHLPDTTITMQENNGTTAHALIEQQTLHLEVAVTLSRLIQHNETGLWFVTQAQTPGITIDQSRLLAPVASPMTLQGTTTLTQGQFAVALFDHTLAPLDILSQPTIKVDTGGTYSGNILFTNDQANQPGLLLIKSIPPDGGSAQGQLVLTSVLLG